MVPPPASFKSVLAFERVLSAFSGEVPTLVDAKPSERCAALAERTERIGWNRCVLLQTLEPLQAVWTFGIIHGTIHLI